MERDFLSLSLDLRAMAIQPESIVSPLFRIELKGMSLLRLIHAEMDGRQRQ